MEPGQVIVSLIGIVAIIIAAYYVTYYLGVKSQKMYQTRNKGRGRNIVLRERFAISKDKSFCIVEIAGKVYVLGITNQSMTVLDTIEAAEYEKAAEGGGAVMAGTQFMGANGLTGAVASFMSKKIAKKRGFDDIANDTVNRSGSGDTDFRDSMANAEKAGNASDEKAKRVEGSAAGDAVAEIVEKAGNTDADRHESEKLDKTNDSEGDK